MIRQAVLLLSCAAALPAQNTIKALIHSVNAAMAADDGQAFANLFTADGDLWRSGTRVGIGREGIARAFQPRGFWSERLPLRLGRESVRMLSPEIAIVDADDVQSGPMLVPRSIPVMMVVKHEEPGWRIVTMHMTSPAPLGILPADSGTPPRARFPRRCAARTV